MFCKHCGTQLNPSARFCGVCGNECQPAADTNVAGNEQAASVMASQPRTNDSLAVGQSMPIGQVTAQAAASLNELQGKTTQYSIQTSLIAFWLKEKIVVTDELLKGDVPNTILGIIPLGTNSISAPMQTISNVSYHSKLFVGRLLIGIFFLAAGFSGIQDIIAYGNLLPLICLIIGILLALNSFQVAIQYEKSGIEKYIFAPFFCASDMKKLKADIEDRLQANNARLFHAQYAMHQMAHSEQVAANQVAAIADAIKQS